MSNDTCNSVDNLQESPMRSSTLENEEKPTVFNREANRLDDAIKNYYSGLIKVYGETYSSWVLKMNQKY